MDFAVKVHHDIGAFVAARQKIAVAFKSFDETTSIGIFAPGLCDLFHALFLRGAGPFFLLFLGEVFGLGVIGETVLAPVVLHAGGKREAVIAGIFLRDGAQFLPVVRKLHCFHFLGIDAGPDDMAVFAPVLDVKHNGAGLVGETELIFGAVDEIVIVIAVEEALPVVGIDGERVEILDALRRLGLRIPFGKGAVEVRRDGAAHVDEFNAVVVEGIEQMGSELLPAAALVSLRDHLLVTFSCRTISYF